MNELEKPKRKFWQFHLSTAMILLVACGVLFFLNFRERRDVSSGSNYTVQGWPFNAAETQHPKVHRNWSEEEWQRYFTPHHTSAITLTNAICALAVLSLIAASAELIIRHRIHYASTLMFAFLACVILWANIVDHRQYEDTFLYRGWPMRYYWSWSEYREGGFGDSIGNLVIDIATIFSIPGVLALALEWWIRRKPDHRREARKT